MKKIISLLLALTCAFALFSCSDDEVSEIDSFIDVVTTSAPTKIITLTSYNDGENENTLIGRFETIIFGTDFQMNYNYQTYAIPTPDADPDSYIIDNVGVVYYWNGEYSEDGESWSVATPGEVALQIKLELTEENLGEYTLSADKKTLTTTVDAEKAKAILGIDVEPMDDGVEIQIVHDGKYLRSISVSYYTETATVEYETSYLYGDVVSPFEPETPPAEE